MRNRLLTTVLIAALTLIAVAPSVSAGEYRTLQQRERVERISTRYIGFFAIIRFPSLAAIINRAHPVDPGQTTTIGTTESADNTAPGGESLRFGGREASGRGRTGAIRARRMLRVFWLTRNEP